MLENNIKSRYDYILIWGHGVSFLDRILKIIRSHENFLIKKIVFHQPQNIKKLVKTIYSYDYAPLEHLRGKTKYLLTSPREVVFIFIKNNNPEDDFFGEHKFRHSESLALKKLKEEIRNRYNPRVDNKRTEQHVIHASDNELQTDYILKYLGHKEGIDIFKQLNPLLSIPYYIPRIRKLHIRKIPINLLLCNLATGEGRYNFEIKSVSITESPQYQGLTTDISIYSNYINKFIGGPLTEDYSAEQLINLSKNFKYLAGDAAASYILVIKKSARYLILDGLHRASILASQGEKHITVAEVLEWN